MAKGYVNTMREHVARQLEAYGEDQLAPRVFDLSEAAWQKLGERALDYACQPDTPSGAGMLIDKALCMAAVEVLEGTRRPLRRKRRVYPK